MVKIIDYNKFLSINELSENSHRLARQYPNKVKLIFYGKSTEGRPLEVLKIGRGQKNILIYGFPHANEPTGGVTTDYLSWKLAEDEDFAKYDDLCWWIVKCANPDGAKLNEPWFTQEYDMRNEMIYFFRDSPERQVDWNFPVVIKKNGKTIYKFKPKIKESIFFLKLVDEIKPLMISPLHNSGFGGIYWYVNEEASDIYNCLLNKAKKLSLTLSLGEPEAPFIKKLYDAFYLEWCFDEEYSYYDKQNKTKIITKGTSCADYCKKYNTFSILSEVPYIWDERIACQNITDVKRRDAALDYIKYKLMIAKYTKNCLKNLRISGKSIILDAISIWAEMTPKLAKIDKKEFETNKSYDRFATVSELFDFKLVRKYYSLRMFGPLIRLAREFGNKKLEEEFYQFLDREIKKLEVKLKIKKTRISDIIDIQVQTIIEGLKHLKNKGKL